MKQYYVYILTSKSCILYVGVTNNLERRIFEHRQKVVPGFTKKYNINRLMYFEVFENIRDAIAREKQIKSWRREKKVALIQATNPMWRDLTEDWHRGSVAGKRSDDRDASTSSA